MSKAPRSGAVKTRLVPPLAPSEAAALNRCFLRDTADTIAAVCADHDSAGIAVYTPVGQEAAFDGLLPASFMLMPQRGEGFGERLLYAAEDLLAVGFRSVCLIDSDSPTLPRGVLEHAVAALAQEGDRVVLGPADDGGYYLIGLKTPHAALFAGIAWSTERVLEQSIAAARQAGIETELLPVWYDVDERESLARLCEELFAPGRPTDRAPHTRAFLQELIEAEGCHRIWPAPPPRPHPA